MGFALKGACAALLLVPAIGYSAEVHPKVQEALDYTLPEMTCNKPELPGVSKDMVDPATGAVRRADVDSYTLGRYKRAEKRWAKCLTKYKKGLMKDFGDLKDSASYGLTGPQATAILSNMKNIQSAIESPIGLPSQESTHQ